MARDARLLAAPDDVRTKRLVWAGTTETIDPSTVVKEAPGFAELIIGQLAARGLVPGPAK